MNRCIFLLDSGAFSVHSRGATIDIEKYAEFVLMNGVYFRGGAFNLDVIGSDRGSYENWRTLRSLGVETIPVHHFGDDEMYLKRYMDEVEYIGLGGMAKLPARARLAGLDDVWKRFLTKSDGTARTRVHGLGMTDNSIILRYPWYSVDSTKSIILAGMGNILVPKFGISGEPDFSEIRQVDVSDQGLDHQRGKLNSFYGMPPLAQRWVLDFVTSCGFTVDLSIQNREVRKLKASRKKKLPEWSSGLGIELESVPADDLQGSRSLTQHWQYRFAVNLITVDRFIDHWSSHIGKGKVHYYHTSYSNGILNVFLDNSPANPSRYLLSFIEFKNHKLIETVRKGVRGGDRADKDA